MTIVPIDVGYMEVEGAANAMLVRAPAGDVLVECGPAASFPVLAAGLHACGSDPARITDLLLTHIHLDHAGAAGHLAATGCQVHVHPFGRPHLLDPAKLLASSRRVHGAAYDRFYGDLLPISERQVHVIEDGARVRVGGMEWEALHTPGHARHHVVWLLSRGDSLHAFMGDLAGIRVPESSHIAIPTPPPEFDPTAWEIGLARVREREPSHLWLTHGGLVAADRVAARAFLDRAIRRLQETTGWLRAAVLRPDAEAVAEGLRFERSIAAAAGVSALRMDQFIDEAFVRMNLGGARRAFMPRD